MPSAAADLLLQHLAKALNRKQPWGPARAKPLQRNSSG
jgi:hypothetical protein